MIKYLIRKKKNQISGTFKYYPQIAPCTPLKLSHIVRRIEKRCTASSSDVKAVLDALEYEILEAISAGNSVRLGDLGSFRPTISAEGCTTAAEAKDKGAALVRHVRVRFTPGTALRLALNEAEISAQGDLLNAE